MEYKEQELLKKELIKLKEIGDYQAMRMKELSSKILKNIKKME